MGTAGTHVNEHHAVCMRAIQYLARKYSGCQKQGGCRVLWVTLPVSCTGSRPEGYLLMVPVHVHQIPSQQSLAFSSSGEHASFFTGVV